MWYSTQWYSLIQKDKSMVVYQVRSKLKGGERVSCESEVFNKGKGRINTKDISYGRVSKHVSEAGTRIST